MKCFKTSLTLYLYLKKHTISVLQDIMTVLSCSNKLLSSFLLVKINSQELVQSTTSLSEEKLQTSQTMIKIQTFKVTSVEKIPVRATLFSAFSAFPYLLALLLKAATAVPDYKTIGQNIKFALTIILSLRCPLTALITFASNKKTS